MKTMLRLFSLFDSQFLTVEQLCNKCTLAIFLACARAFQANADAFLETGGGGDFLTLYSEKHRAGSYVTTWSHRTSDDQWNPGSAADTFVVPNSNVKQCVEVLKIGWDASKQTCFVFCYRDQCQESNDSKTGGNHCKLEHNFG